MRHFRKAIRKQDAQPFIDPLIRGQTCALLEASWHRKKEIALVDIDRGLKPETDNAVFTPPGPCVATL